jgi:3-hydroxyacyl-CoA dehydrogenase
MHLFNPPNVITGCEVIPHRETDPELSRFVVDFLEQRLGRKVIETADTPAFAGNRVGFKVLNEVAQLAEEHGVWYMDALIGPHTGRAMAPLGTVDFVGWDVHRAIVDNMYANTKDEAHGAFAMPGYMKPLLEKGHLGNKGATGGFYQTKKNADKQVPPEVFVLDPKRGELRPAAEMKVPTPELASKMKAMHRLGRYKQAMALMLEAKGKDADLMRQVVLGYVSYGLGRVGEVVKASKDVDRIMGFGFNWAPPGVLVDVLGARATIAALEKARLAVPACLAEAASKGTRMFAEPHTDVGRFFFA